MKKFNKIKNTDKYKYLDILFKDIKNLEGIYDIILDSLRQDVMEFAGYELLNAYTFGQEFEKIKEYSNKFFDCEDDGFSYELGCRYMKIDFDFPENIDSEINHLKSLLKIYDKKFSNEIIIINNLINDLKSFKKDFIKYYNS